MAMQVYASPADVLGDLVAKKITQTEAEAALTACRNRQEALDKARKEGESSARKAVDVADGVKVAIDSWGNVTLSGYDRIGHGSGRMAASLSGSALLFLFQHASTIVGKVCDAVGQGTERTEAYAKKTDKAGAKTGLRRYCGAVRVAEEDANFFDGITGLQSALLADGKEEAAA